MNKFLKTLFTLVILGVFIYVFRQPIIEIITKIRLEYTPCQNPIAYEIGSLDKRFGLSEKALVDALKDAEVVWDKQICKDLFAYTQGGDLKVNLVYDYRQQATSTLLALGIEVKDSKASYNAIKQKYEALQIIYKDIKADYVVRVAEFQNRQDSYSKKVSLWNAKGGAPKREYDQLEKEQEALQVEFANIKQIEATINKYVDELNAMVVVLNRLATTLNLNVERYNEIGASQGEEFQEGLYQRDSSGEKIDIYEFSNRDQLVRVLAHELGHALGLEHISDPNAIMYKLNQGKTNIPTKADINALKIRCGIK